jgi:aminoglycoside phosphotransferase (APT) family kinase protein
LTTVPAPPRGIDSERLSPWLADHVPGAVPPFTFTLLAGGHSNLTFRFDDAGARSWVLRRPPLGHVLPTAHDMGREHRIIAALAATDVPVPEAVALCTDPEVNGAPFYVMSYVDGIVVRDPKVASTLPGEVREHASRSVVDVLAMIHLVDVDAVGLGGLARKEGYVERQLTRWYRQWNDSKTRELRAIDEVHRILSANIPPQTRTGIVHGDYRLDNCIVGRDGAVRAVLDWELCTLGDTMCDLGQMLVGWAEPGDQAATPDRPPTLAGGFWTREQVVERYVERTGANPADLAFYQALAAWKLACIVEGVYARYLHGAMGDKVPEHGIDGFRTRVERLATRAAEGAARLRPASSG